MATTAIIETKFGEIEVEFFADKAPGHVKNFQDLAKQGFYDGTTFHRVIPGFMIQGGDPEYQGPEAARRERHGSGGPGYSIKAEFNDTPHKRGVLSMARSSSPDSAGCQFFICVGRFGLPRSPVHGVRQGRARHRGRRPDRECGARRAGQPEGPDRHEGPHRRLRRSLDARPSVRQGGHAVAACARGRLPSEPAGAKPRVRRSSRRAPPVSHAGSVEIEVKLRVASPEAASSLLVRSGARRVEARHFEDNRLFDDAAGSLRARGVSLRLRRTPAAVRPSPTRAPGASRDGLKAREERETNMEDADAMQAILLALGLSPVFRYQKYREVWALGEAEVVVDETPIGQLPRDRGRSRRDPRRRFEARLLAARVRRRVLRRRYSWPRAARGTCSSREGDDPGRGPGRAHAAAECARRQARAAQCSIGRSSTGRWNVWRARVSATWSSTRITCRARSGAQSATAMRFGLRVRFSHEAEILGTGGGPRRVRRWLGEGPVLLVNGDAWFDFDLRALVRLPPRARRARDTRPAAQSRTHDLRPDRHGSWRRDPLPGGEASPRGTARSRSSPASTSSTRRCSGGFPSGAATACAICTRRSLPRASALLGVRVKGAWYDFGGPSLYLASQLALLRGSSTRATCLVDPARAGGFGRCARAGDRRGRQRHRGGRRGSPQRVVGRRRRRGRGRGRRQRSWRAACG